MKTSAALTLADMQAKWVGRQVYSSTDHRLDNSGRHPRPVTEVWLKAETGEWFAFAGEHHRANSAAALDRRLQSLEV